MTERAELIIDTVEIDDENVLFLTPNHITGVKYCASNIFDYASIEHCPTEKLNSGVLIGVFNSLKPSAELSIIVDQPISVMLEYDSKQIEANLRLVGFEDIKYNEKNSTDKRLLEGILTAIKPVNKEKDVQIEIIKSEYSSRSHTDKKKYNDNNREDRGGYRIQKEVERVEEFKEEPYSKYKKGGRFGNTTTIEYKTEREENIPTKKYNRFQKKEEEEPKYKDNVVQKEIIVKEEKKVYPKRFGYTKEEKPQTIEHKTEVVSKVAERPSNIATKSVVVTRTTVVDKNADLENKKASLRKRYGKH